MSHEPVYHELTKSTSTPAMDRLFEVEQLYDRMTPDLDYDRLDEGDDYHAREATALGFFIGRQNFREDAYSEEKGGDVEVGIPHHEGAAYAMAQELFSDALNQTKFVTGYRAATRGREIEL